MDMIGAAVPDIGGRHLSYTAAVVAMATALVAWAPMATARAQGGPAPAIAGVDQTRAFSIPPQPLADALTAFGLQSNLQVSVDGELVRGVASPGATGTMAPTEALSRLLSGTGLVFTLSGSGTVTLQRYAGPPGSAAIALAPITVAGDAIGTTTEGTGSYTTGTMNTATKIPASIRETPQAVTVVSRRRMDDQGMTDITDVVDNTPGLFLRKSDGPGRPSFHARGFSIDTVMQDGIASGFKSWQTGAHPDLAMYDRVEVVRGATGLTTGSGNPSAAINLVRKRPTVEPQYSATASAGSWDNYRGELDASGALVEGGALRARMVATYQDAGTFRDAEAFEHALLYGIAEADLGERTTVSFGLSHQHDDTNNFWGGLPLTADGRHMDLPRSTFPGNAWERRDQNLLTAFADVEHRIDGSWRLKGTAMRSWQTLDWLGTYLRRTGTPALRHYAYQVEYEEEQSSYDLYASGPVRLFDRDHELVFGASRRQLSLTTDLHGWAYLNDDVDLTTWDPGSLPEPDFPSTGSTRNVTTEHGLYATGRFSLADPLTLILGSRVDWYDYDDRSGNGDYRVDRNITLYGGLVYDIDRHHSIYASYTDIFLPQTSKGVSGQVIAPILGSNYEAGVKGEYFGGALNASLALFRIDQKNRAKLLTDQTACATFPATSCYEASGLVRSRGIDVEIQGAILPNWQVAAGYTYVHATYVKDADPANVGARFETMEPEHLFKLSTVYTLPGDLDRWRVGANLYWQSRIYADGSYNGLDFRNEQKAYAVTDLMAGYRVTDNLDLQLNVNNLFDTVYYKSIAYDANWGPQDIYGEPRNVRLTARARF